VYRPVILYLLSCYMCVSMSVSVYLNMRLQRAHGHGHACVSAERWRMVTNVSIRMRVSVNDGMSRES